MAPSPWAVIKNAETPIAPDLGPWAPIPDEPMEGVQLPAKSVANHFGEGQGRAIPAPQVAAKEVSPMASEIGNTQDQLANTRWHQANPWGTAENHPGKLGKVAHVFSEIGNIAGNVVAPAVMANIPGSQLNMQEKESGLSGRLAKEVQQQSTEQEQGANAAHLNAETPEVAPNAESTRKTQGAQAENLESETASRDQMTAEGPPLANAYAHAVNQAIKNGVDPSTDPIVQHLADAITGIQPEKTGRGMEHVAVESGGKQMEANYDPQRGQYIDLQGNILKDARPIPPVAAMGPVVIAPTGQVERATPGKTLPEGFRTIQQQGSMNTPTSQSRNMAEMAQTVLPQMQNVTHEVDQMATALGPSVGRWNQLMINKGGTDYPQFAKLDTDLDLLASAIVRTHFGARGGQQYREELRKMFGEAQTPEDLKARIAGANGWLQGYARMAGGNTPPEPQQPTIPEGYVLRDGPKGRGYYAPTAAK